MDHSNTDTGTRVELHCHTKLGSVGAVNSATEIIKAAIEEAMSANCSRTPAFLSLIHISEPTRPY